MARSTEYRAEIAAASASHALDPTLVEAIVIRESSGLTHAYRFEPLFWGRYLRNSPVWKDANPHRVSASYGLMQVLYISAQELGFADEPEFLFVPSVGLEWGCKKLASLLEWAKGTPTATPEDQRLAAIAAYNGGRGGNVPGSTQLRNGVYARQVMTLYNDLLRVV